MKKNTIAKDTVRITLITLVAGFALGLVNEITNEPIAQQEAKAKAEACKAVFEKYDVHGVVHMTGGGFYENIPRIIPDGLGAEIEVGTWEVPEIFKYIKKCGNIEAKEMFSTFNMGVGMLLTVAPADAEGVMSVLRAVGEKPSIIGKISAKEGISIIKDGEVL